MEPKQGKGWWVEAATKKEVKTEAGKEFRWVSCFGIDGQPGGGSHISFSFSVLDSQFTRMFSKGGLVQCFQNMETPEYGVDISPPSTGRGRLSASAGYKWFLSRSSRMNFCFENPIHAWSARHFWLWVVNSFLLHGFMARFRLCPLLNLMEEFLPVAF